MTISIIVSVLALAIALASAVFSYRSSRAATRSANAVEASERRARTPELVIVLDRPTPAPNDRVIYRVRNDGPQDLDSVLVYRPRPTDGIKYPITITGGCTGWAVDEVDLGPLALTEEARFTLCCSAAQQLPEFRVRIECRSGTEEWTVHKLLPSPRGPAPATA